MLVCTVRRTDIALRQKKIRHDMADIEQVERIAFCGICIREPEEYENPVSTPQSIRI
jgi:hypothetical protein